MMNKWKIVVPVGIAAVAVIAVAVYFQTVTRTPRYAAEEGVTGEKAGEQQQVASVPPVSVPAAATAGVDDAVNALLQEASADQAAFAAVENDLSLLGADSQAISDFGQSYNESDF